MVNLLRLWAMLCLVQGSRRQTAKNDIRNLNRRDCVIIWGRSNDISKNESIKGLKHITDSAVQNQHPSIIIIMPDLHRYDFLKSSCIDTETQTFNRKLGKMIKTVSHVKLLDMKLDRVDFT
jgi:hypothetical protein